MIYSGEYIILGPPGTGKTFRVAQSTAKIVKENRTAFGTIHPNPVMICSLTRTAAAEAAGRVDIDRQMVGTLHAHAYRSLGHPKIVSPADYTEWNELNPQWLIAEGCTDLDDFSNDRSENSVFTSYQLARALMSDDYDTEFHEAWESFKFERELLDFTDLIELAYLTIDHAPNDPQVIIADEAQDMSRAEFALLKKWGAAAEALILVGDPYQALYTWRGADPDYLLNHEVPENHRDVLSQSYRVPPAVHKVATSWLQAESTNYKPVEYKARVVGGDRANDSVGISDTNWRTPEGVLEEVETHLSRGQSVMVLASCGYMLKPTIRELKEKGIPFSNPWRRKRGDWNPLRKGLSLRFVSFCNFLNALQNDKPMSIDDIHTWIQVMKAKGLLLRGAKEQIKARAAIHDTPPVYEYELHNYFEYDEIEYLKNFHLENNSIQCRATWFNDRLLNKHQDSFEYPRHVAEINGIVALEKEPQLFIGTIHSFKGAEADVVIIYPDLSRAGYDEWNDHVSGHDSVVRLFYVALTRAKQSVIITAPVSRMYAELENYL